MLFYETKTLTEIRARNLIAVPGSRQNRIAVLLDQKELLVLSNPVVRTEIDFGRNDLSRMEWSPSDGYLAAMMRTGELWLMTPMCVRVKVAQYPNQIEAVSSFAHLNESILILVSLDGRICLWDLGEERGWTVMDVRRYHDCPQISTHQDKRCALAGLNGRNEFNVTVWEFVDGFTRMELKYCLKNPLSRFQIWFGRQSTTTDKCGMDFSPDGNRLAVFKRDRLPLVLRFRESSVESEEVRSVGNSDQALFWTENILVLLSDSNRIVFVDATDMRVLSSEPVEAETRLLGRIDPVGFLKLSKRPEESFAMELYVKQTAGEHLASLIGQCKFEAAMNAADLAGLPKEPIYKAIWVAREAPSIALEDFQVFLDNIRDEEWKIDACCQAITASLDDQRIIFETGLTACIHYIGKLGFAKYAKLICGLERLATFGAIHGGGFSPEAFSHFRQEKLRDIATKFARAADTNSLLVDCLVLFRHHAYSLFRLIPTVLMNLPATLSMSEYSKLLPAPGMTPSSYGFETTLPSKFLDLPFDISETEVEIEDLPDALLTKIPAMTDLSFNEADLQAFYLQFGLKIESETGDLTLCREILMYGIQRGIKGDLETELRGLTRFESWIQCSPSLWNWNSESFRNLSTEEVVKQVLDPMSLDQALEFLKTKLTSLTRSFTPPEKMYLGKVLFPYCLKRKSELFRGLIVIECRESILFGAQPDGREAFLEAVASAVETVDKIKDWDALRDSIQSILRKVQSSDQAKISLTRLHHICKLAALLEKHGLRLCYTNLSGLSLGEGQTWIRSVLGHAMRTSAHWTDDQWEELLEDLTDIAHSIGEICGSDFDLYSVHADFFRTLLRSSKFDLAAQFTNHNLDSNAAEEIAWTIGREMLCSITNLDSDDVKEAKSCFYLFPTSSRAQSEISKLNSLISVRSNFKISVLPIQFEHLKEKTDLINQIVEANKKNYKNKDVLLKICNDLRFSDQEFFESWQLLCRSALDHHDIRKAIEYLNDLRDRKLNRSWELAREVLLLDDSQGYLNRSEKEILWSFVIANCDSQLQECINNMRASFEQFQPEDPVSPEPDCFPTCEDIYLYLSSEEYRRSLKTQTDQFCKQKCKVYDLVHSALEAVNNVDDRSADFVQKLLQTPPRDIAEALKSGKAFLHSEEDFDERISSLTEQDRLHTLCAAIYSVLPGMDQSRFCERGNTEYRKQIAKELAAYAGELLYIQSRPDRRKDSSDLDWRVVWDLALENGENLGATKTDIACCFVSSIASVVDCPFGEMEQQVVDIETHLLDDRGEYLKRVVEEAWKEAGNVYAVAFLLRLAVRSLSSDNQPLQQVTAALFSFAFKILHLDDSFEDFDFRVMVFPVLAEILADQLGFEMRRHAEGSLIQNVYSAVEDKNCGAVIELLKLIGLPNRDALDLDESRVHLCLMAKKILDLAKIEELRLFDFWRAHLAVLSDAEVRSLVEFAVFKDCSRLLDILWGLDEPTRTQVRDWAATTEVDIQQAIALLEAALEQDKKPVEFVDELKRLKRESAKAVLGDIGADISSDDFAENAKNVIGQLISSNKSYSEIFESISDFAKGSEEDHSPTRISDLIRIVVEDRIKSVEDDRSIGEIVNLLETAEGSDEVSDLQNTTWSLLLRRLKEKPDNQVHYLSELLMSVARRNVWTKRRWEIISEDIWTLISILLQFKVSEESTSISNLESLDGVEAAIQELQDRDLKIALQFLDAFGNISDLPGHADMADWLSNHYLSALTMGVQSTSVETVLEFLIEMKIRKEDKTALSSEQCEGLLGHFRINYPDVAIHAGLLLPSTELNKTTLEGLDPAQKDCVLLMTILAFYPECKIDRLLDEESLGSCPPHFSLIAEWHADDSPKIQEDEAVLSGSADGWDIDEDMDFGETENPKSDPDGWSDLDELENALQGETSASQEADEAIALAESSKTPSVAIVLTAEEREIIQACCFPSLLGALVLQDKVDLASSLLTSKLNMHSYADGLSCGPILLKRYFKKCSQVDSEWSKDFVSKLKTEWIRKIAFHLIDESAEVFESASAELQ